MEMLGEIIQELTKAKGNYTITNENVLTWAKRPISGNECYNRGKGI